MFRRTIVTKANIVNWLTAILLKLSERLGRSIQILRFRSAWLTPCAPKCWIRNSTKESRSSCCPTFMGILSQMWRQSIRAALGRRLLRILEINMPFGYGDRKAILDEALDICTITERKKIVTTDVDGASAAEFTDYLLETLDRLKK